MKTAAAPPFLLPSERVVRANPWTDSTGVPVPDLLVDWDPHTDLTLRREMIVNLTLLREETLVGEASTLALLPSWASSTTRLSGAGSAAELGTIRAPVRVALELYVPGRLAGGRLDLRTALVLRSADDGAPAIAARRAGSILWSDTQRVTVEGAAARFPVTAVRFSLLPTTPDGTAWFLEWDPDDLESPASGALRLLINADRKDVVAALRTGGLAPGAEGLRSFVRLDVARAMIHAALRSDRFVEGAERWEEESLGRLLAGLVGQVWPGTSLANLRARLLEEPARIDGEIQAAFPVVIA